MLCSLTRMLLVPFAVLLLLLLLQLHLMLLPRELPWLLVVNLLLLLLLEVRLLLVLLYLLLRLPPFHLQAPVWPITSSRSTAWLHKLCQLLLLVAKQHQH
jgi:hypothetical protein